jgi:hypothetical protein
LTPKRGGRGCCSIGFQVLGVRDGQREITVTLIGKTGITRTWKDSSGCTWTSANTGYAPSSEWSGCGGSNSDADVKLVSGSPYPLKVGNTWKYTVDGRGWSNFRDCEVKGIEAIETISGKHTAYKVVCEENSSTRTYYRSPKFDYSVRAERSCSRGYVWELKKVVSTGAAK